MVGGKLSEPPFKEVYAELDVTVFFLEVTDVLFAIVGVNARIFNGNEVTHFVLVPQRFNPFEPLATWACTFRFCTRHGCIRPIAPCRYIQKIPPIAIAILLMPRHPNSSSSRSTLLNLPFQKRGSSRGRRCRERCRCYRGRS